MNFPTPYDLNEFAGIEVLDQNGDLLFKSCDKRTVGLWLIENDMIRTSEIGDYYEEGEGTI